MYAENLQLKSAKADTEVQQALPAELELEFLRINGCAVPKEQLARYTGRPKRRRP